MSGLHISHTSTFMQVLEQIVTRPKLLNFCNADCFIVNCVGLTPLSSHIQRIRAFINYMLNPFQTTFSSFFLYYPAHIIFSKKINDSEQESTAGPFMKALWGNDSIFLCLIHNSLQECIIRFRIKFNIDFSCHIVG